MAARSHFANRLTSIRPAMQRASAALPGVPGLPSRFRTKINFWKKIQIDSADHDPANLVYEKARLQLQNAKMGV